MSTLASVVIYDIYSNLPAAGIAGRMFYVSTGTNAGNGYRDNGASWDLVVTPGGGGGGGGLLGTAIFNPSAGSIGSLVIAGIVTGVVYNAVGRYTIQLSGSPTDYLPQVMIGNDSGIDSAEVNPVANYGTSGFDIAVVLSASSLTDPARVYVCVFKL